MQRSHIAQMTSAYFAFDFSWGYYYAGFFGFAKYTSAAMDTRKRERVPLYL